MSPLWGVGHIWRGGSNLALRRGNFGVPYTIYNKDMEAEVFMMGGGHIRARGDGVMASVQGSVQGV